MNARIASLPLLSAALLAGCSDDDGHDHAHEDTSSDVAITDTGADVAADAGVVSASDDTADTETDAGFVLPEGQFLIFSRVQGPDNRTMYASIVDGLDVGTLDLGDALEQSGLSRARVHNGKLFAFDGETGVVSRYSIGADGTLTLDTLEGGDEARVSFAGLGVTQFSDLHLFANDTQAFYVDMIFTDTVVEWNPTDMTITNSFDADISRDGFDASSGAYSRVGDVFVMPVSWSNQFTFEARLVSAVAVLDASNPTAVTIVEDDRCAGTSATFVWDDTVYAFNDSINGLADILSPEGTLPAPCLLRWEVGDSDFDSDYYVNLRELTGFDHFAGATSLGDGTISTQVYDSDEDPRTLGIFDVLDGPHWSRAIIDLSTETTTVVDGLRQSSMANAGWAIEGAYYVPLTDEEEGVAHLHRLGDETVTPLLTVAGEIFRVSPVE